MNECCALVFQYAERPSGESAGYGSASSAHGGVGAADGEDVGDGSNDADMAANGEGDGDDSPTANPHPHATTKAVRHAAARQRTLRARQCALPIGIRIVSTAKRQVVSGSLGASLSGGFDQQSADVDMRVRFCGGQGTRSRFR
jgi:hypothetical protein